MSKRISLISFIEDDNVFVSHAYNRIAGLVGEFYPKAGAFESFTDAKDMLKGLSASFSHSKIVVVSATASRYLNLKKLLFQALNLETESSNVILTAIAQHASEESAEARLSHATVPKNSTVFLSEDGLLSGFAVKSGKQHLIVIPLDLERLDDIFENGFTAYLKGATSPDEISTDATEQKNTVTSVLPKLISEGICFAVANNKTAALIKSRLSVADAWEDCFKFVDCEEEKKGLTQKEFVADLARQAQEKSGCSAGVAISNVFTSEKEDGRMFVLVTVADKLRARVAKVYAEPEENAPQLVAAAVETLLTMAADYVDAGGFNSFPVNQDTVEMPEDERRNRGRLAIKLFISGLIVAIICILIVLFGGQLVNAVRDFTGKGSESTQTQTADSALSSDFDESSSETESMAGGVYDPEYLISLLAQASSYAAEENSSTAADKSTSTTTQNTTNLSVKVTKTVISITATTTTKPTEATTVTTTTKPTEATTVTTTTKPTIATTVTTTKPTAATTVATTATTTTSTVATTSANPNQYAGTFSFSVKGYGHGVGMSQEGAKSYARQGWTYDKILLHYYTPGVTLLDDTNLPERVTYGGNSIELIEYLARTVAQEIGTGSPIEALKAQTVAAYTFAKSYGFDVSGGQHAYSTTFNLDLNSNVMKAVNEVAGKYLSYGGNPINAFYFASAAGQTVSSASVWGGTVPYLQGGVSSPESVSQSRKSYSAAEIKAFVDEYNSNPKFSSKKITLQDNPAEWIKIIDADSAGYINTIRVGDQVMRGYSFRQDLFKLRIRSHCFAFTYTSA